MGFRIRLLKNFSAFVNFTNSRVSMVRGSWNSEAPILQRLLKWQCRIWRSPQHQRKFFLVSSLLSTVVMTFNGQYIAQCDSLAVIERNYKTENALAELLSTIRTTLDQIGTGPIQLSNHNKSYVAVIHHDFIRLQLVSKANNDVLEFVDCEFHWMSSDITRADFCRIQADDANGSRVDIDHADAFDLIYRTVYKISVDLPGKKCQIMKMNRS